MSETLKSLTELNFPDLILTPLFGSFTENIWCCCSLIFPDVTSPSSILQQTTIPHIFWIDIFMYKPDVFWFWNVHFSDGFYKLHRHLSGIFLLVESRFSVGRNAQAGLVLWLDGGLTGSGFTQIRCGFLEPLKARQWVLNLHPRPKPTSWSNQSEPSISCAVYKFHSAMTEQLNPLGPGFWDGGLNVVLRKSTTVKLVDGFPGTGIPCPVNKLLFPLCDPKDQMIGPRWGIVVRLSIAPPLQSSLCDLLRMLQLQQKAKTSAFSVNAV